MNNRSPRQQEPSEASSRNAAGARAGNAGWGAITLLPNPLPGFEADDVDTTVHFLGRDYPVPLLIQARGTDGEGHDENGLGSGVVISAQGDILTALHVVEGAEEILLTFADGSQVAGQVVATQPENDIAVLQPVEIPPLVFPAVLGNPNAMQVGDVAFAVGNPFGLYGSMSSGVISGFNRSFETEDGPRIEGLIQIDSAVNPGNSGGPLLNRSGQVVGIVIGILNPTDGEFFIGIGFAVPITVAGGAAGAPQY